MSFSNSCFVSYRAGTNPGALRLYKTFCEELHQQTDLYMPGLNVFLDQSRLTGGNFLADQLAGELCRSVCMIMLFSPDYFDPGHTFCAREYAGMLDLEERRRKHCAALVADAHGLIIPVIIRGSLPEPISALRKYYQLSDQLLAAEDVRRRGVRQVLRHIADDVYKRYSQLGGSQASLGGHCDGFALPTAAKVMKLVNEMSAPREKFPWQ